jgi:cardiolipin synthase A/B
MARPPVAASAFLALAFATGCGDGEPLALELDATSVESKLVPLVASSHELAIVSLTAPPSEGLRAALADAAHRGVLVRVSMVEGDYVATIATMQALETDGVDADVVEAVPGDVVAVIDAAAFVPEGTKLKKKTNASTVAALRTELEALLEPPLPELASDKLAPPETVRVLQMPEASSARLVQVLAAAATSIDLSVYQVGDRRVIGALKDAAARGVKVRVMAEPKTVTGASYDALAAELGGAGIAVQPTPPYFDDSHNVDHAKFIVVDDAELLLGSGNLVRSGIGGETLDTYDTRDVWIEDTRAASLTEARVLFDADWSRTPTAGTAFDRLVVTPDNASERIRAMVDEADERVLVENQFFSDKDLLARLAAAVERGVTVEVLVGYQPWLDDPPPNQSAIDQLVAAGAEAAYFSRHYLHGKLLVADGRAFVGSQNFTKGGLVRNRELGVVLDDEALVAELAASFAADAAHPDH